MNAPFRTSGGGRIDRSVTHTFTFGGRELTGHAGDTLASALLANGIHQISTSIKLGRPRGITAAEPRREYCIGTSHTGGCQACRLGPR